MPETATRFRSTPAAAVARRHTRRRGPANRRCSPPAPPACSLPPHHRSTRRPAVHPPAPIGARALLAHRLRPALPAAQAAWFRQRNRDPDRGRDPDRHSDARYGSGARPARRRQRWFPTAPPRSYSTRRSAGRPAPTHGAGTAASPGCAAARRRRRSAAPAPRSRTGSRTRAAAPDRADRSRRDGPACARRGSNDGKKVCQPLRPIFIGLPTFFRHKPPVALSHARTWCAVGPDGRTDARRRAPRSAQGRGGPPACPGALRARQV